MVLFIRLFFFIDIFKNMYEIFYIFVTIIMKLSPDDKTFCWLVAVTPFRR